MNSGTLIPIPTEKLVVRPPRRPKPHAKSTNAPVTKPLNRCPSKQAKMKQNQLMNQEFMSKPEPKMSKQRLQQFLQYQEAYSRQRQQKLAKAKEQAVRKEQQQFRFRPELSRFTQELDRSDLIKRLHQHRRTLQSKEEQSFSFQPSINSRSRQLVREQSVSQILSKDARRRQDQKSKDKSPVHANSPLVSQKNCQLATNKLRKDIDAACGHLRLAKRDWTPPQLCSLLKQLGFIGQDGLSPRRIEQVQSFIKARGNGVAGLCVLLSGVKGLSKQSGQVKAQFPFLKDSFRSKIRVESELSDLFVPQIQPRSKELSKESQRKLIQRSMGLVPNAKLSQPDRLWLHQIDRDIRVEALRQIQQQQQQRQCTFAPQTRKHKLPSRQGISLLSHGYLQCTFSGPGAAKDQQYSGQTANTRRPILQLQVQIEGQLQSLVVCEGDDPRQVALHFSERHRLSPSDRARLADLIAAEISKAKLKRSLFQ